MLLFDGTPPSFGYDDPVKLLLERDGLKWQAVYSCRMCRLCCDCSIVIACVLLSHSTSGALRRAGGAK